MININQISDMAHGPLVIANERVSWISTTVIDMSASLEWSVMEPVTELLSIFRSSKICLVSVEQWIKSTLLLQKLYQIYFVNVFSFKKVSFLQIMKTKKKHEKKSDPNLSCTVLLNSFCFDTEKHISNKNR